MHGLVRSRRLWEAMLALIAALVALPLVGGAQKAAAHPLGNFTINHYSRVELSPERIGVRYVLDMAEIPAFQEQRQIDADGDSQITRSEGDAYLVRQVQS